MTPRVDVVGLATPVSFADVARAVRRSGHSHFPVYTDDFDHLLGVLFVKDLFSLGPALRGGRERGVQSEVLSGADVTARLARALRRPRVALAALEILADMRRRRRGFAVVVDEYGGFAGVITMNDLVSELVGDLRDEFDRTTSPAILRIDARRYLVDGACARRRGRRGTRPRDPGGRLRHARGVPLRRARPHPGRVARPTSSTGGPSASHRMDKRRIAKVVVEAPSATIAPGDGASRASDGK